MHGTEGMSNYGIITDTHSSVFNLNSISYSYVFSITMFWIPSFQMGPRWIEEMQTGKGERISGAAWPVQGGNGGD